MSEVGQPPSEEQQMRLRLSVLEAVLLAAARRDEVLDAVAEARDPEDARQSVAEVLAIEADTAAAQAVVELRLRSFTQSEVARCQAETEDLRSRLDQAL